MNLQINKPGLNIFEVGVGDTFSSNSLKFWSNPQNSITLFEPNPLLYKSLLGQVGGCQNICLHNVAIGGENKIGNLVMAGVLSYMPDIPSPISSIFLGKITEMLRHHIVPVNVATFDLFDPGDIDILMLGMEGAEYTVFEHIASRPHVIFLHNYFANDYGYTFPKFDSIQKWCNYNGYQILNGIPTLTLVNVRSVQSGAISLSQ